MNINPVIIAIPLYFVLIGLELIYQAFTSKKIYRLNDALTNISCGITQQISKLYLKFFSLFVYQWVFENFAILKIPDNWWSFILLFVLADFCYYWSHRMSHEINLFWGGHVVHHQSEDYNLSVALRQSSTSVLFSFMFYLPLALIGFSTEAFIFTIAINLIYQFWIHTETVGKLGWLEYVFNTPSHHRVHHGVNPKYIDKNHAGVFIVWDMLFGTFQKEEEKPTYGITSPIRSWNPIWVNFSHYNTILSNLNQMKGLQDKLKYLFYKPGWQPDYLGGFQHPQEVNVKEYKKFDVAIHKKVNYYVLFQYIVALGITAIFLFTQQNYDLLNKSLFAGYVVYTITVCGGLLEHSKWSKIGEFLRPVLLVLLIGWMVPFSTLDVYVLISIYTYAIISLVWFLSLRPFQQIKHA